jgi:hypothetical protein
MIEPRYLAWLRQQRCACGCLQGPPCDAAHLRAGSIIYNKPRLGIGEKPDDQWALSLLHAHHMDQHAHGNELEWWKARGIDDPFALARRYFERWKYGRKEWPL